MFSIVGNTTWRPVLKGFVEVVFVVVDDIARQHKEMSWKNWKESDETDLIVCIENAQQIVRPSKNSTSRKLF